MNGGFCVLLSLMTNDALSSAFGARWKDVLGHCSDGVIVMDHERQLQFANSRARKMLGLTEDEDFSGRCRLRTRGMDCEIACPLTFALEQGKMEIRDFETSYHTRDGRPVPLRVTVLPLFGPGGEFVGAVEILRPRCVDQGFLLAGVGSVLEVLRSRLAMIATGDADVVFVGERSAREDVARTLARMSGLGDERFVIWPGSEAESRPESGGIYFADDGQASALWQTELPALWRRCVGVLDVDCLGVVSEREFEVVHLPSPRDVKDDLPLVIAAWVQKFRKELDLTAPALGRLVEIALKSGFDGVAEVLPAAVVAARDRLEVNDLPQPSSQVLFIDEVLETEDPLATLEQRLLTEVLERTEWRTQEAADRLGMSRVTLWRKTRDYGIERPSVCEERR